MKANVLHKSYEHYDALCRTVAQCKKCPRMEGSARVLNRSAGKLDARVMFIGEAPGRLGADASAIPFHGDKAGHNFEALLDAAGLNRSEIFVTNAVLCNPKDENGNNATPSLREIENCVGYLKEQIELVDPSIVVTLGVSSLRATSLIEHHRLSLSKNVRTSNSWYMRRLIPLYHPGQRAMIHRSYANQQSDYRFVVEQLDKLGVRPRRATGRTRADVAAIAELIVTAIPGLSLFALHKLLYLAELFHVRDYGGQLTKAYFVRQKDGPYCVDLHPQKLQKAIPSLTINRGGVLSINPQASRDLFSDSVGAVPSIANEIEEEVMQVVLKYGRLNDAQLKTKVYLTSPMRRILREEKRTGRGMYNVPIDILHT